MPRVLVKTDLGATHLVVITPKVGRIEVYMSRSLHDGTWQVPHINWSCVGSTPFTDAEDFRDGMTQAVFYARRMERERVKLNAKIAEQVKQQGEGKA